MADFLSRPQCVKCVCVWKIASILQASPYKWVWNMILGPILLKWINFNLIMDK